MIQQPIEVLEAATLTPLQEDAKRILTNHGIAFTFHGPWVIAQGHMITTHANITSAIVAHNIEGAV